MSQGTGVVSTMSAVVQAGYGPPGEVLRLGRVPVPDPGERGVLVRVAAAPVSGTDWHLLRGLPYAARPVTGWSRPRSVVPGLELAGVVAAVGDGVTRFGVGDRVYGWGEGAWAEYAAVPENQLAAAPERLTLEEAALVPIAFFTAVQAVRDKGQVGPGDRVLVTGASGGVGTYAVQLATWLGAEVTAVCSGAKADLVRSLGAVEVIDYTRENLADRAAGFDVLVDLYGNPSLRDCRRVLRPGGTVVFVGGTGGRWFMGVDRWLRAMAAAPLLGRRVRPLIHRDRLEDLLTASDLIADGHLRPVLDRVLPAGHAAGAVELVRQGQARGQVAISFVADRTGEAG